MRAGPIRSMTPYPRRSVPGSMPRILTTSGYAFQGRFVHVEVRVHVLDVVVVLERVQQLEGALGFLAGEVHGVLGDHGDLRRAGLGQAGLLEPVADGLELLGRGDDEDGVSLVADVLGAQLDG